MSIEDAGTGRGRTHGERAGDGDEDDLLALPLVRAQLDRCPSGEDERTNVDVGIVRARVEEDERY